MTDSYTASDGIGVEEILDSVGVYASITRGCSMLPLFKAGRDVIFVTPISAPPKRYDVILYKSHGKYVLHRIIGFKNGTYITRGDNNFFKETVPCENVIGILSHYNRNGREYTADRAAFRFRGILNRLSYPVRFVLRKIKAFLRPVYRKMKRKS